MPGLFVIRSDGSVCADAARRDDINIFFDHAHISVDRVQRAGQKIDHPLRGAFRKFGQINDRGFARKQTVDHVGNFVVRLRVIHVDRIFRVVVFLLRRLRFPRFCVAGRAGRFLFRLVRKFVRFSGSFLFVASFGNKIKKIHEITPVLNLVETDAAVLF